MQHRRTHRPTRAAFTLIELLIVITIIALLVALTTAGVVKVFATAKRAEVSHDIMKLQNGLRTAMQQYGKAPVLPSRLVLFNNLNRYSSNPPTGETAMDIKLRQRSADALRKMFGPRLLLNGTQVQWDGTANDSKTVLEGQQCLVFYLGGMVVNGSCIGFSTDPLNPMNANSTDRIGPFFEFKKSRLVPANGAPNGKSYGSNAFAVYLDPYHDPVEPLAQPYAYFSSTTAPNTYNPYGTSDCASLGGLLPYQDPTGTFLNPNNFQIISAGADGLFGPGGASVYNPAFGATDLATRDNQANFSQSVLGTAQN